MLAAVQALDALNPDAAGAVAFNFRAHLDEHFGQIADFRLLRGVFEDGFTLGERGSHQEVFRAGDRHHVGGDVGALQARLAFGQAGQHVAVLDDDMRAHRLQALDVLIDRPRADGAAARQRDTRPAKARQQRAEGQHRGAHGLDQLVRRFGRMQRARVQRDGVGISGAALGLNAHVADQLEHGGHVLQRGHVVQRDGVSGQQRGAQLGQCRILGTGNRHCARQGLAAPDD